jgi:hypothetical protein
MYPQKEISKTNKKKKLFFVGILEVTDERAGSGYRFELNCTDPRIRIHRYQNVTNLELCLVDTMKQKTPLKKKERNLPISEKL